MKASYRQRIVRLTRWLSWCLALTAFVACDHHQASELETPNILLVAIDTLGAEHVGCLNPTLHHTPHIDRLAQEGILFSRAYSPAPWTQPAMASLFTSRMPSELGVVRLFDALAPDHTTLAEIVHEQGLDTAGFISHELLDRSYGFSQGFDVYDAASVGGHRAVTSQAVTDRAIAWLDQRSTTNPFLLFVHYFDPHFVYHDHSRLDSTNDYQGSLRDSEMEILPLRERRASLTSEDIAYLVALYHEEIAYTDAHVGRLLARLRELGLTERTLVVLLADHGEEFMRHGWIGHTRTLYDELLHVPLIWSWPGKLTPQIIDTPVSLLDVMPTILDVLGVKAPGPSTGLSLRALFAGQPAPTRDLFAEVSFTPWEPDSRADKTAFKTALMSGDLKLVHDLLSESWELYDRGVDAEELCDLFGDHPRQEELQQRLLAWESARDEGSTVTDRRVAPTGETIDDLRALGYLN